MVHQEHFEQGKGSVVSSPWRIGREAAMAESRISGQAPVKPEQARPRSCAVCGVRGDSRQLIDCDGQYLCELCATPGEQNRRRYDVGRELRRLGRLGQEEADNG